jgi:hypothetical protein
MLKYIISRFLPTPDKTKTKQKNKDYEAVPALLALPQQKIVIII